MTTKKNLTRNISNLILLAIILGVTITYTVAEDNYKTDNSILTNVYEATLTENGYKTNIIINPHTTGIYASENGYKLDFAINPQGIGGSLEENGYKLDLIPEKTFPDPADVAVTKIATSKTIVGQGYSIRISVTLSNQALNYETFYFTINANTTVINAQTITLTSGNSITLTFTWNTTGFAKGNYTISAYATPVQGETDTKDNTIDSWVFLTILGDVNGDKKVDITDISMTIAAYGKTSKSPGWYTPTWYANRDLNNDGKIDISDISTVIAQYGKKW